MKERQILDALNGIKEEYIEEAAEATPVRRYSWHKWGALAACLALVVGVGVYTLSPPGSSPTPTATPTATSPGDLPILNVEFIGGDMGFESLLQYDPAELSPNNPWGEDAVLETLPVYRNLAYPGEFPAPHYFGEEELLRRAEEVAVALDTVIERTEYSYVSRISSSPNSSEEEKVAYRITAQTPLGEIEVAGTGGISIFFDPAIALPEEYSFTYSDTTNEEAEVTISYLLERFSALYAPEITAVDTGGDYNIYGEQHRTYRVYDGSGELTQQLLSYCFDGITFSPDEEGNLWIIRVGNLLENAEKIGDYPIITAQQARELLLEGSYLTTVPSEYLTDGKITEDAIAKVELVYRTNLYEPTFMPYYRFYVELEELHPDSWAEGLIDYGAYYVPAVEGEYLSGLPAPDHLFFN